MSAYKRQKKAIPWTVLHVQLVYFAVFPQDKDLNSAEWNCDSYECVGIWKDTVVTTCILRYYARRGLHAVHTRWLSTSHVQTVNMRARQTVNGVIMTC